MNPAATRSVQGDQGFDPGAGARVLLPETPAAYRPRTLADALGMSRPAISAAISRGDLGAVRLRGTVLISRASAQVWLDRFSQPWKTT